MDRPSPDETQIVARDVVVEALAANPVALLVVDVPFGLVVRTDRGPAEGAVLVVPAVLNDFAG
jgi:hypothetical protein